MDDSAAVSGENGAEAELGIVWFKSAALVSVVLKECKGE